MADPISIIGTGAGVVSLGFQIYGELKKYLDTYAGRDTQVSKALDHLEQLASTLAVIKNIIPDFESEQRLSSDTVTLNLQQCEKEMRVLQAELRKHESLAHTDMKGKMKEAKKKLKYPFARDTLAELEGRLERVLKYLSLAVDGLKLSSLSSINTKVSSLNSSAQIHMTALDEIKAEEITTSNRLTEVRNDIMPLAGELHNLTTQTGTCFTHLENKMQTYQDSTNMRLENIEVNFESLRSLLLQATDGQTSTPNLGVESVLTRRLLSKPSLLRDTQEAVDSVLEDRHDLTVHQSGSQQSRASNTDLSLMGTRASTCCCHRKRREVKRQSRTWSLFILTSDASSESRHHSYCPVYRAENTQGKQEWTITFTGLQRLLSTAVSVGFSMTYGAGGGGIGPIFRYYAMVDKTQSPAFRIVNLILGAFHYKERCTEENGIEIFHRVFSHGISRMQTVYTNGTASPTDVDSTGGTVLDHVALFTTYYKWPTPRRLDNILSTLHELGIPSKNQEQLCAKLGCSSHYIPDDFGKHVAMALRETPECNYHWLSGVFNPATAGIWIYEIAEALEFDTLCTSFTQKDEKTLRHTLSSQPKLFDYFEEYSFRNVFFPLAVHWPEGFRILLDAIPSIISSTKTFSIPLSDYTARLLTIVVRDCALVCTSQEHEVLCDDFNCSESLEILLDHKYFLSSGGILMIMSRVGLTYPAKVAYVLLQHLKQWRERLWGLLAEHLPKRFQQTRPEDTPLLDAEAPRAVAELESIGISPYTLFGLERGDYRLGPKLHEDFFIHHITPSAEIAQMAFDMGFRDVDVVSCGKTPLMSAVCKSFDFSLDHYEWLAQHGADVTRHVSWANKEPFLCETVAPLPRHTILHKAAVRMSEPLLERGLPLASRIRDSRNGDGCTCACSPGSGCSPLTIYLNQWILLECLDSETHSGGTIDTRIGSGLFHQIYLFTTEEPIDDNATSELAETIIRCLTFSRLEIRHTCCNSIDYGYGTVFTNTLPVDYDSDFEELRAEDMGRLCQLEHLVTEFIEQYRQYGGTILAFLRGPWTEQMDLIDAEESKEKWSEHKKLSVTSIGVILKDTEDIGPEEGPVEWPVKASEPDYMAQLEYWIKKIDIIANEGRDIL